MKIELKSRSNIGDVDEIYYSMRLAGIILALLPNTAHIAAMEISAGDSVQQARSEDSAILSAYLSHIVNTQPDVPKDRMICVSERYIEETPEWNLRLVKLVEKNEEEGSKFKRLRGKPEPRIAAQELVAIADLDLKTSQAPIAAPECSTRPRHTISHPIIYKDQAFVVSYVSRPPCATYGVISRLDKVGASWSVVATASLFTSLPSAGCGQFWRLSDLDDVKGRFYIIGE